MNKINAVIMGGGNGVAKTTRALKHNLDILNISSVVTMSDSTGSSGRLRGEFNCLPPGDILRAVLSLSKYKYGMLKPIFYKTRFKKVNKLNDHNLGNLFLILSEQYGGNLIDSIRSLEQSVEAVGHTYPATLDITDLVAELDNGDTIRTEGNIDRPSYSKDIKIKKLYAEPSGQAYSGAMKQIENADIIFFGPGSLYCSVIASLLPKGIFEGIKKSKAKLIYIAGDAYELKGETGPTKLSDCIKQLENYLPRKLDTVIFNNTQLTDGQKNMYNNKQWGLIEFDQANLKDVNVIADDYEQDDGGLDTEKLGKIIKKLILG